MRRPLLAALVLALLLPPGARAADPLWSSSMALGPTDVAGLAARGSTVLAGGRPVIKDVNRVIPGPRTPGLFRSEDLGRSWALASEPVADAEGEVHLEPITRTPDLLAMPGTDAFALFGTEVWRSEDDGRVWARVGATPGPVATLSSLADDRLVAGMGSGGLRVTSDRGVTWSALGTGLPSSRVNDVLAVDALILLVATDAGVYRSANGGESFTQSSTGLASANAAALGVTGEAASALYLATAAGTGTLVYQSLDLGLTWALRSAPAWQNLLPAVTRGAFELVVASFEGGISGLYAGTQQGLFVATLWAGGGGGPNVDLPGLAWTRIEPQPGGRSVGALVRSDFVDGPYRYDVVYAAIRRASPFVAGFGFGGWRFAAPGWYDELDLGRVCGDMLVHRDGTLFVACGHHVFRSTDGGATFSAADEGLPYVTLGSPDNPYDPLESSVDGTLWTSDFDSGLWHSNPTQTSWSKVPSYPGASVGLLAAHPNASSVLFASGTTTNHSGRYVLWRTRDTGTTWTPMPEVGDNITSVDVTEWGNVLVTSSGDGAFLSMNLGDGWARLNLPADTFRAVFSPADLSVAWASSGSGADTLLHRSDDGGRTWREIGSSPPGGLVAAPWDVDTLYLSDYSAGFFASHDGGLTWEPFTDGLPSGFGTVRNNLVADPTNPGRLYATGGWIASDTAPQDEWVYRAQDPAF